MDANTIGMRLFRCDSCDNLLFYENSRCLRCGAEVGFDPEQRSMRVLPVDGLQRCQEGAPGCNWLVGTGGATGQCRSCRLTILRPTDPATQSDAWCTLENAKRRLLHTLTGLGLPVDEMRFAFPETGLTGHANGIITVLMSEAHDPERIRRQHELGEPFRTLIGHFRHESGHYFHSWLMADDATVERFRACFGDERQDYQAALQLHYQAGPPADWSRSYVSAYASAHPHEDWAETWAHYLHMHDAMEISRAYGLTLSPVPDHADRPAEVVNLERIVVGDFEQMIRAWIPLTWFANSLNRSIGHSDWYPFAPAPTVVAKLKFVHDLLR